MTGLRWWCCTELIPSVMDLFLRYLNLHSFPPAFAEGAQPCLFYGWPFFSAALSNISLFFLRRPLINVVVTVDVSECCLIVLLLYHHVCRCAPMETHSRTTRLQILFYFILLS